MGEASKKGPITLTIDSGLLWKLFSGLGIFGGLMPFLGGYAGSGDQAEAVQAAEQRISAAYVHKICVSNGYHPASMDVAADGPPSLVIVEPPR